MPSPQAPANLLQSSCEDRVQGTPQLDGPSINPKEIMSILKDFSFLGRLHSKINFIYSCKVLRLIPVGFKLKWSEQTGFEDPNLIEKVLDTLKQTSLNLLDMVLTEKFRRS